MGKKIFTILRWFFGLSRPVTITIDCKPSRTQIILSIYSVWLVSLPLWRLHELLDTQWVHRKDSDPNLLIVRIVSLCWTHMLFCWFGESLLDTRYFVGLVSLCWTHMLFCWFGESLLDTHVILLVWWVFAGHTCYFVGLVSLCWTHMLFCWFGESLLDTHVILLVWWVFAGHTLFCWFGASSLL